MVLNIKHFILFSAAVVLRCRGVGTEGGGEGGGGSSWSLNDSLTHNMLELWSPDLTGQPQLVFYTTGGESSPTLDPIDHWSCASPFLSAVANESGLNWSMGCEAERSSVSLPSWRRRMTTSVNPYWPVESRSYRTIYRCRTTTNC